MGGGRSGTAERGEESEAKCALARSQREAKEEEEEAV